MFTRLPVVKGREPSCLGDCGHISHISHPIAQKCGKYFEVEISKECLMSRFPNLAFYASALTNHPCIISYSKFIYDEHWKTGGYFKEFNCYGVMRPGCFPDNHIVINDLPFIFVEFG